MEMIPQTRKEKKPYCKQTICHLCKKEFVDDNDDDNDKSYLKFCDHSLCTCKYTGAAHTLCNLR